MTDFTFVIGKYRGEGLQKELSHLLGRALAVGMPASARRKRTVMILSPLLVLLGAYLIISGVRKSSPGFFALGVLSLLGGFCYAWLNRPEAPQTALAKQLLTSLNSIESSSKATVLFDGGGAVIRARNNEVSIPFDHVAAAGESKRLYILMHDRSATVLQKSDLVGGDTQAFAAYLREKTEGRYVTYQLS